MAEENGQSKYIICSDCRSKYINDEHINTDLGYTRLEMRYKTCVKCRARKIIKNKTYHEKHPGKTKYYEAHKEEAKEHNKQYRDTNADRLEEYDRAKNQIQLCCPHCNGEIVKRKLNSHLQTQKCKSFVKPNENEE